MKNILILIFAACGLYSCDSFVEVDLPESQLTGAVVFEDRNTANAALADIFAKLRDKGVLSGQTLSLIYTLGLYSDELIYYGSGTNEEYNNALIPTSGLPQSMWNDSYHQIYCANAALEGLKASVALADADKKQFEGEALFVRALVHFYLLNIYGDIPYVTGTDYEVNRLATRTPAAVMYEQITADLLQAVALLPTDYIDAERGRPNSATAQALLARVYLYQGKWAEASNAASAVINDPLYVWETDIQKVFLKEATTTIWQFAPKTPGVATNEGSLFYFQNGPPRLVALRPEFADSFESGDLRRSEWIADVTTGDNTWYRAFKYKQNVNGGTSTEHSIVFRLAEQYLIRAEARAMQGELSGAKEDLNQIRHLAGLENTVAVTAPEIVAAVLKERRAELFTEFGHRFFDLKRSGKLDTVLESVKPGWETTDQLWPIPENELLSNPKLTPQNPGY